MNKISEKIKAGKLIFNSRLIMPPMATEKSLDGKVSDELIAYYDDMTKGGYLGMVITEHSFVAMSGKASKNQVSIAEDEDIEGLKKIADVIHKNQVPVIIQINHAGSAAKSEITGLPLYCASDVVHPMKAMRASFKEKDEIHVMSLEDINEIKRNFVDAANRAKKAGFDGVEVHAAHGYLLGQFYSPITNKRSDIYNGNTLEGRTRLQREIIEEIRRETGDDFFISLRFGACDYREGGADISDVAEAASIFEEAGADMLSISGNMYGYTVPGVNEPGWFSDLSYEAKKNVKIPVLLTGGINDGESAEKLLEEGKADLIGIGRAFLKDPELIKNIIEAVGQMDR